MGYHINMRNSKFFISTKHVKEALNAIKSLAGKETITDGSGKHFSWVNTNTFLAANTLTEALYEWRWGIKTDAKGNVVSINFEGEKLGDDNILFNAIATYVRSGSYIEMIGEDGAMWRWVFKNKAFKEVHSRIVWD